MNRRLYLLLVTMLLLAGYAGWSHSGAWTALIGAAKEPPAKKIALAVPPATKASPPAALNPLAGFDERAVAAIVERPLFTPSRRSAAPPPTPEPAAAEEPAIVTVPQGRVLAAEDFTLLAVSNTDRSKVAVVRVGGSDGVFYLREGQPILDWRVLHVGTRDVKIGDDRESVTLTMFGKPHAAPDTPDGTADAMTPAAAPSTDTN